MDELIGIRGAMAAVYLAIFAAGTTPWRVRELGHSEIAAWDSSQSVVIRDAVRFRDAWTKLFPVPALRPALPLVDFTKWRVLVVAAGTRPTGGYRVVLDSGRVVRDSATIFVTLRTPAKDCGVAQQLTTPAVAIAIPVHPDPYRVIFHERADTARCH
jgi:hypothetical protein